MIVTDVPGIPLVTAGGGLAYARVDPDDFVSEIEAGQVASDWRREHMTHAVEGQVAA